MSDLSTAIPALLESSGFATRIRNAVCLLHEQAMQNDECKQPPGQPPLPRPDEPLSCVAEAQTKWKKFLMDRMIEISKEQGIPLAKVKSQDSETSKRTRDGQQLPSKRRSKLSASTSSLVGTEKGGESDSGTPLPVLRCAFKPSDLMRAITSIENTNHSSASIGIPSWNIVPLELKTRDLRSLQRKFSELHPDLRQVGMDDELTPWFGMERYSLGKRVLSNGRTLVMRQYAKRGIPAPLRPAMWLAILNSNLEQGTRDFAFLMSEMQRIELLSDEMYRQDAKRVGNTDSFFIFEDVMESVMTCFGRDTSLRERCAVNLPFFQSLDRGGRERGCYPPNGVVPFDGITFFCGPICFLYPKTEECFVVFRALFAKYFCRLLCLSSRDECLASLCKLFEDLLKTHESEMFYHMMQLGLHPLRLAFTWIVRAFAGIIEVEQLLLLWDRILAFDSLELIPILAASIFSFRSVAILSAESAAEIEDIMSDFSTVRVAPMLQAFLFQDLLKSAATIAALGGGTPSSFN